MRGAVVSKNLTPIREYSSTVNDRQKCVTVYSRVVVKGLTVKPVQFVGREPWKMFGALTFSQKKMFFVTNTLLYFLGVDPS